MKLIQQLKARFLWRDIPIAPLITFRVLFGGLMMVGAVRFMLNGWIERLYGEPVFFFKYYGFEWVEVFSVPGMYALYSAIALSAAMMMLGLFYRAAAVTFFLTFTYSELTDVTNYLNHYYLVCLLGFLMIFLPAHRRFSLDVRRRPERRLTRVPAWTIHVLMLQIGIVYFFAGFAKLNTDWLFHAMPLATWLPARADLPIIGWPFEYAWAPFAFSWAGAFYDLTIPFFLLNRRTRPFAYAAVVVFHGLTHVLFNIGLFPFIMIFNTLVFFPGKTHERWWVKGRFFLKKWSPRAVPRLVVDRLLSAFSNTVGISEAESKTPTSSQRAGDLELHFSGFPAFFEKTGSLPNRLSGLAKKSLPALFVIFFLIQLALPLRYLLYPGHVLWTEEGYRFAWRVMLVEKAGQATFTIRDPATGRSGEVINSDYLTKFQEKQMAIQPDLILQFAHFLADEYRKEYGIADPQVTVDCHVSLNGRSSRPFIDPNVNLVAVEDGLRHKPWILPFKQQ